MLLKSAFFNEKVLFPKCEYILIIRLSFYFLRILEMLDLAKCLLVSKTLYYYPQEVGKYFTHTQ